MIKTWAFCDGVTLQHVTDLAWSAAIENNVYSDDDEDHDDDDDDNEDDDDDETLEKDNLDLSNCNHDNSDDGDEDNAEDIVPMMTANVAPSIAMV